MRNNVQRHRVPRGLAFVLVPVLVLVAAELGLRWAGRGYDPDFFVTARSGSAERVTGNHRFAWRFFPRMLAREPVLFTFAPRKPRDTYRVFVVGESAAAGVPAVAYGFGRILESAWNLQHSEHPLEVINTASVAFNSHVALPICREIRAYEPDAVIIYLGNTEVVGPFGAGTILHRQGDSLWGIRASLGWRRTALGQWLDGMHEDFERDAATYRRWQGMEMFMGHAVEADDPALDLVYGHFRTNLRDLCATLTAAGTPVLLCTIPTNVRDAYPFASATAQQLSTVHQRQWDTAFARGSELARADQHVAAIEAFQAAGAIDDGHAELRFRMGRCALAAERWEEAREHLLAGRDRDTLRFRADTRINQTVREVAARENGIRLIDLATALGRAAHPETGLCGKEMFLEHVHLTTDGNYAVARILLEQLESCLGSPVTPAAAAAPTRSACLDAIGYTGWTVTRILEETLRMVSRPPFTEQPDHAQRVAWLRGALGRGREVLDSESAKRLPLRYRQKLATRPEDVLLKSAFAEFLSGMGYYTEAADTWGELAGAVPCNPRVLYNAGTAVARVGRAGDAERLLREAARRDPYHADSWSNLAGVLYSRARDEEAERAAEEALRLAPDLAEAWNTLGGIRAKRRQFAEAETAYRRAIALNPRYAEAHNNFGALLEAGGKRDAAVAQYHAAARLHPAYVEPHHNLGRLYLREKGWKAALPHWLRVAALRPEDANAHYHLAVAQAACGQVEEAAASLGVALRLRPGWREAEAALARLRQARGQP